VAAVVLHVEAADEQAPDQGETASYECGIVSEQEPVERFPVRFYLSR